MSETSARTGRQAKGVKGALRIDRIYTTPGVHPYDEVDWERRDVVLTNWRDGSINFEQRGVEFPGFWQPNAVQIVASKYFRGALGTPQREWSLKQLIDRVVLTYVKTGKKHGYFASAADAEVFEHELTYALLHQIVTFNSPVWFNVGTKSPHQVSACFLLAVDDSMDSILDWYKEEGLIFKGGSGSGVNLSRIRSSKELLSSGGSASGPVSFMRGADASAGTIKSGGATRRAAKMVILDVDHPDIEEFIETKVREEEKIRVLRDAGFDMDLGGDDIHSVQYQNANNSVRVSDDFMRLVEGGGEFGLRARLTGEVVEIVQARNLWQKMCKAAWTCADPGIQYDDTINDWHTCPESGRITTSNPCAEYVHLDNSSCNLASINLLKFLGEDNRTFDVAKFAKISELLITAMDISISFADFPTKKIGEVTRAYRQLGMGYANLGALLMAAGLAYDSDGGRAFAGAITSLMTATAYRRSAEIAAAVGPYDGYARNAEGHTRVMRKHQAASRAARIIDDRDRSVWDAANAEWEKCLELGGRYGWRNAQATLLAPTGTSGLAMDVDTTGIEPALGLVTFKKLVGGGSMQFVNQTVQRALRTLGYQQEQAEAVVEHIGQQGNVVNAPGLKTEHYPVFDCAMGERSIAPMGHVRMMAAVQPFLSGAISKCVVGSTLVTTADGLVRIGGLHQGESEDSFRPMSLGVASLDGLRDTDAFYYGGQRATIRVKLRSGHRVIGTPNHRVLVGVASGGLEWRRLDELEEGDQVATQYGDELWSKCPARLDGFLASLPYGSQKSISVPVEMSDELAFFLGAYAAEGHIARSNHTVRIANADEQVITRLVGSAQRLFGIRARVARQPGKCPSVELSAKTLVEFFDYLSCGDSSSNKRIPDAVLRSPRSAVLAFLEGLSLDSYLPRSLPKWAICLASNDLLDDLQAVLTNLGIVHSRITKYNAEYDRSFDEVYTSGRHAQRFTSMLQFPEAHKAARVSELAAMMLGGGTADLVPGISGRELYGLIPNGRSGRSGAGTGVSRQFRHLVDPRTHRVSRASLEEVATIPDVELPDWLEVVLDRNLHFSPVAEIGDGGEREVFDISVPGTRAFVGNGIVNHNTVNMPETATVEDVENIYLQGWKLGLKALAIYRDNCKVGQPLSVSKGSSTTAETEPQKDFEYRPVRKRLPKKRPSQTISFSVGSAEGYLTASSYPDDGLGEVFLRMSKQGSTLAGVMDAFSIAISIGLQYGVPLETYVSKFTNMRFEPAGMTDDSDVRMATSVMDYIFRRLALDFLPYERRADLGIFTAAERTAQVREENGDVDLSTMTSSAAKSSPSAVKQSPESPLAATSAPSGAHSSTELLEMMQGKAADAPLCFTCGIKMRPAGACFVCEGCGSTSGCS